MIIGPSGSGKSSVVRALAGVGALRVHPTWTTRPRRDDERDGSVEHVFVSDADFDARDRAGGFLDTVAMFGLPYRYGLPPIDRAVDGRIDTVMLRAPLVERFARFVPDHVVFQIEDDPARVEERLRARGGSADDLRARLDDNERELRAGRLVASRVFVNDRGIDDLAAAIRAALPALVSA